MKILLITQYFWPESFIINDIVKCLIAQGHTIEVLTGKPNYPDGEIFQGYTAGGYQTEIFAEKILVHRIPIYPRGKGGAKRLLFNYFSFVFSGFFYFYRKVKKKQFDIVLVYIPSPITAVIPAVYLKWRLNLHLVVWVQDLWPESLRATGFVKNKYLLQAIGHLVRLIYFFSDTLLIPSKAFYKSISKYAAKEKIIYYPNSYLESSVHPNDTEQIPQDLLLQLKHNHCFIFAGNLGKAQSVETLVQAAKQLQHLPNCKLILIGSGSMSDWLVRQISENHLDNVILAGRFAPSMMPRLFAQAAGLIVTLKKDEIFDYTIPSKIQAYLAAGRPIVAALDGEGARIIVDAGAGLVCPAEDAIALAEKIEELYYLPLPKRDELGLSGRAYFLKHFEMMSQCKQLIDILEERIAKKCKPFVFESH